MKPLFPSAFVLATLTLGAPIAVAQGSTAGKGGRFTVGIASGAYGQSSANSFLGKSDEATAVAVRGTAFMVGGAALGFDGELAYDAVDAKATTYYRERRDLALSVGPQLESLPFIVPTLGLYRQAQKSDRTAADAPIAFVDETQTLMLGLRARGTPLRFGDHGVVVMGQAHYLTNGQSGLNDGRLLRLGAGYSYGADAFAATLTLGWETTALHAGTRTDGIRRDVRSTLTGTTAAIGVDF